MHSFEALVLSGGGIKGFGMLGILHQLLINGLDIDNIKKLVGSSIGGIIAAMLCFDFSPIEICLFFIFYFLPIKSLSVDKERLIEKLKIVFKDSTFKDVYQKKGKILILTSFDKHKKTSIYYSKDLYPDKKIIDAVSETSNIPFIMNTNDIYIDGCLCSPFPLKYTKDCFNNPKVLGIYTFATNNNLLPIPNPYDDLKIILHQLYNTIISYEIMFASTPDQIIKFEAQIPFEIFQFELNLAKQLFLNGYFQTL